VTKRTIIHLRESITDTILLRSLRHRIHAVPTYSIETLTALVDQFKVVSGLYSHIDIILLSLARFGRGYIMRTLKRRSGSQTHHPPIMLSFSTANLVSALALCSTLTGLVLANGPRTQCTGTASFTSMTCLSMGTNCALYLCIQ
jgi:hypothetical protein